ncbi:hypothetical protein M8J76_006035 [Diaphorina citri]|nr:hypothetical protein M8J76_006035 [Diaphorina citri]
MYEGEVHFISRNDCSMYVSTLLLNGLHRKYPFYNILIAKITNTKNKKVFYSLIKGWNESKNDDNIYFNKKFANSVDLQEKDIVHFDVVDANTLNTLSKVFFKTTPEDYVKMDTCSVKLEDTILNQVRCVCKNSKLPIWINNQIVIFIFIDSLEPSCDFGLLQQDTELHFVPPEPESHKPSINQPQPTTMLGSLVNNYFNLSHMDVSFNEFCNRPMYARVCSLGPQKPGIQKGSKISKNSYCVYLNKKLKSHAKLKSEHSSWPVFAFHQLNFKHESQTDLEFCSQIDELEDVRSYDNDASIISTKNENVSDANTNHCNTKNIKDSHMPKDAESKNLPDIDEDIDKDFLVKFFHASYYPILNHNAILSLSVRSMTIPIRVELIPSSVKYCLYDNKIQREVQISYEEYVPVKQKVVQSEGGVLTSNLGAISTEVMKILKLVSI